MLEDLASTRVIERFCHEHGIKRKGTVSDAAPDVLVKGASHQLLFIDIYELIGTCIDIIPYSMQIQS